MRTFERQISEIVKAAGLTAVSVHYSYSGGDRWVAYVHRADNCASGHAETSARRAIAVAIAELNVKEDAAEPMAPMSEAA